MKKLLGLMVCGFVLGAAAADVSVCKFFEGKSGVFLLAFDDACMSQLANAIPVLEKYRVPGTFYPITEAGHFQARKADWIKAAKSPYVTLGNHTSTHKGFKAPDELDVQLKDANAVLKAMQPELPWPRLISFAVPGGVPWEISDAVLKAKLDAQHLVERPKFQTPPWFCKTVAEAEAYIDKCLAEKKMGHIDFHGIGGDWLSNPTEYLEGVAKKLDAVRDRMWLAAAADWNKYDAEQAAAQVKVETETADTLALTVSLGTLDPKIYDSPLTLEIKSDWPRARVQAGCKVSEVAAQNGVLRVTVPTGVKIVLKKLD